MGALTAPTEAATAYCGRFAPSPTGLLHFGSLVGALASFLDARAQAGRWLLRIDDIDPPRAQPGAAAAILQSLTDHGLQWDGEVLYQSTQFAAYRAALVSLLDQDLAFYCTCSRTELAALGAGRCQCQGLRTAPAAPFAVRLAVDNHPIEFLDAIQGRVQQNLASAGDFVLWRKEDLPAYQLAVVVDDAACAITHVVRGCDLLDSTPRQCFLQSKLGLPTPHYAHIPVIAHLDGTKLSKQTLARPLNGAQAPANLRAALAFLQQIAPPADRLSVQAILEFAVANWQLARIPRQGQLSGTQLPLACRHFAS